MQHRVLFDEYVTELREVAEQANAWFQALVDVEEERTGDLAQAEMNVKERRPVGPVADGSVIAVVRRFWLACAELNIGETETERVAPEEFILKWLVTAGHDDLAELLSGFPFWPVGLDNSDNWV
ncbi:MAG: hypothetical protein ACYTDY_00755 [Planctomycetota bacterium]